MSVVTSLVTIVLCVINLATCEEERYDFIIVGAGSAGSILANRLSESGEYSVLLLELGGYPVIIRHVPALLPVMYFTPNTQHWVYEPQDQAARGFKEGKAPWYRGTGLGGSSLINYMIFTRGHREDYDRWAAMGNPGWSYEEVLPYFKKYENVKLPEVDGSVRGSNGEMNVSHIPYKSGAVHAFIDACKEAGIDHNPDYNSGHAFGANFLQSNIRNGKRCDSEKAFLQPAYTRKNLKIKTHSTVTKLIIDEGIKTILGVEYDTPYSKNNKVMANKEVILSAGAANTPQLLMLSGIGPKEHLEELDIKVIKDLPVGKIMYEHSMYLGLVFQLNSSITPTFSDFFSPIQWGKFLLQGTGKLTVPALVIEGLGLIKTPESNETIDYPDVELLFASGSLGTDYGIFFKTQFRVTDAAYDSLFKPMEGKHTWSAFLFPYHPRSKGQLKLRSKDPRDSPLFYGNFYSDPENKDIKTAIAGIRVAQKISASPTFQKYGSKIHLAAIPGCENHELDSDDFWECQVRHLSAGLWHQVATCKMGPKDDPEAVVDNKLRVHGMKKLRIADITIIPRPLSAHTNSPATMIGEKAGAMILEEHNDSI